MSNVNFLRPRLEGARFENGGIPKDVLPNLIALQEMVIAVARWQYLKDNPNSARAPSGFNKVNLELVGVESGSAVPVFELTTTQRTLNEQIPHQKTFEKAREFIVGIINHVEQEGRLPPAEDLPDDILEHLKRVGHDLRDDETLELNTTTHQTPAKLTRKTRSKLLHLASTVKHVSEMVLRGSVHKIDQKNMTFGLQQVYGPLVTGQIPDAYYDIIMQTFDRYKDNTRIQIQCTTQRNQHGQISIESITHIKPLDSLDVLLQLDEFRSLRDDWLDGNGLAPKHSNLDWLSGVFGRYYPRDLPLPHTYPTAEGGVSLEWSFDGREAHIEIDLERRTGEWFVINMKTGKSEDEDEDVNLDDPKNWLQIADHLRRLKEKTE
ncbi:MAG: hypothetical protein F4245_00795 [Cenarchaeum sp. SB0678_bin_8]|nr:hypothetical protein [Cenarchaeum sp. SB0666_bin_15]MYD58148.1 hypothetical protein [Cenarchaeum sp. SB0678_bin_8]MYJ27435.1 hypothetical protein [Cenarchaeum sp. SB0672_bin_9]